MDKIQLLDQLKKSTEELIQTATNEFMTCDPIDLNAKPSPTSWSAYECFEHMGISNAHYRKGFEKKVMTLSSTEQANASVFKSGFLGSYFVKSMTPKTNGEIPSKMKTLKVFKPKGQNNAILIQKFIEDQKFFLEVIERSKELNLTKIKVVSALGRIVTFRLGDALRFNTGHNQRHMIQARKALEVRVPVG